MHEKKYMDKDNLMPKKGRIFSSIEALSLIEKG
jgi:hypothetical protein